MTTNEEKFSVGKIAIRKVFVAIISTIKHYYLIVGKVTEKQKSFSVKNSLYKDSSHDYFIEFKKYYT